MARTCRIGPPRPTSLQGRATQAERHKGSRVRPRYGMRDEACLTQCWRAIRKDAASGVAQGSAQASAQPLDEHLHALVERLTQTRDRATRVRRPSMPTGAGTQRPLGIPAGEATRLPRAGARLRAALYAQDFLRGREGYRPHGGALAAVETLTITRQCGR
jgi:hypothetical protein